MNQPPQHYQPPTGQFYAPPQQPKKGLPAAAIVGIVLGSFALLLCIGGAIVAVVQPDQPRSNTAAPAATTTAPRAAATTAAPAPPPTTAPPAGPLASFGDGTYEVGAAPGLVAPGKYKATVPTDSFGCYWERLKGLSGQFSDIIANGLGEPGSPVIVTIAPTDKGFKTTGCGSWAKS